MPKLWKYLESIIDCEITVDYNNHIKQPIGHELLLQLQTSQKCGVFYVTWRIENNSNKNPPGAGTPEGSYPQTEGL